MNEQIFFSFQALFSSVENVSCCLLLYSCRRPDSLVQEVNEWVRLPYGSFPRSTHDRRTTIPKAAHISAEGSHSVCITKRHPSTRFGLNTRGKQLGGQIQRKSGRNCRESSSFNSPYFSLPFQRWFLNSGFVFSKLLIDNDEWMTDASHPYQIRPVRYPASGPSSAPSPHGSLID
jgi:hypothetical protein